MRDHTSDWHAPVSELALCSDVECGAVFLLSRGQCPACAGAVFTGLAAVVNRSQPVDRRGRLVHCQACGHQRDDHGPEGCELTQCPCVGYLNRLKRRLIAHALAAAGGNVSAAARSLGLHRPYLAKLIRDQVLVPARYRCGTCQHWWGQHSRLGCGVPGCACGRGHARPASPTQHVRATRPPADIGRP